MMNPQELAKRFHDLYEQLAPQFGYETRQDTRHFDPESANGRLMIAVCTKLAEQVALDLGGEDRDRKRIEELDRQVIQLSTQLVRMKEWLDNNTTFQDLNLGGGGGAAGSIGAGGGVGSVGVGEFDAILAHVSVRIWHHETHDRETFPFSALVERQALNHPVESYEQDQEIIDIGLQYEQVRDHLWKVAKSNNTFCATYAASLIRSFAIEGPEGEDPEEA